VIKMRVVKLIFFLILIFPGLIYSQQRGIGLKDEGQISSEKFYRYSWALVIGIDNYLYAPKLRYAVRDAKAVAEVLINEYGFEKDKVIELYDSKATRSEIFKAFDRLKNNAKSNDRVLIFFAGHGVTEQLPDGRDKGYILPYDGKMDELLSTTISTDQLAEISQMLRAKHVFFVMDACYGGLIFARATPISLSTLEYLEVVTTRKARRALTAGGRNQAVFDMGPGGHSVFTYYFIKALKDKMADLNRDGIITTAELNEFVAPKVTAESKKLQTPEYGILAGDEGGDFIFIPSSFVLSFDVTINSIPLGANITIDGEAAGVTPVKVNLTQGEHTVRIEKEGYKTSIEKIYVSSDNRIFTFNLSPELLKLTIEVSPKDADLYIDNIKVEGSGTYLLSPGKHTVVAMKKNYKTIEKDIILNQDDYLNLTLPPVEDVSVEIRANVPDAVVYIDGNLVNYLSQGKVRLNIPAGTRTIKVASEGYKAMEKIVQLKVGEEYIINFNLEPELIPIEIKSNVLDADVYIDDVKVGKLDNGFGVFYVLQGKRYIKLEKEFYIPASKSVFVRGNEKLSINLNLEPFPVLSIKSNVPDAEIFINDTAYGKLKDGKADIKVGRGTKKLRLVKEGYKAASIYKYIDKNETVTIELEKIFGILDLSIYPANTDIYVYVDNQLVQQALKLQAKSVNFKLRIPYGSHNILIKAPGYKPYEFTVDIKSEENLFRTVILRETPENIARRIYDSKMRAKKGAITFSILSLTATGIGAFIYHSKSEKLYDEYMKLTKLVEMQKKYNEYKKTVQIRNILIASSAIFAVSSVYFLIKKVDYDKIYKDVIKSEVSLNYISSGNVKMVSVSVRF